MRQNVLLIVFDTARADAFEPWGAAPGTTPTMAQLSHSGDAIEHAYATACWTVPSHGSMFLGQLPRTSSLTQGTHAWFARVLASQQDRLLPEVLRRAGYRTAAVSANLWVSPRAGFDSGFDEFVDVHTERATSLANHSWRASARWALQSLRARVDDGAASIERLLRDWLGETSANRRRPFFWFVNLVECHSPYLPPRPWNDLGAVERLRAGSDARHHQSFEAFCKASLGGFTVREDALMRMRHLYGQAVALLDAWLARVLAELEQAGVLDETLIVVTSDHGENFGEAGLMGHCFSLDNRLIRIPLVASGPGTWTAERAWSLSELPRCIANAVGLDEHPWAKSAIPGVAVAQIDGLCEPDDPKGRASVAALGLGDDAFDRLVASYTVATDGYWKLFRRDGTESLIDLTEDPLELSPVPVGAMRETERPDTLASLRAALDLATATENPVSIRDRGSSDLDADLQARMELLGYM